MLTDNQRLSLNRAICDYVRHNGASNELVAQLDSLLLANAPQDNADAIATQDTKLLEKKWNSIVKLQSRIMDLEKYSAELQKSIDEEQTTQKQISDASLDWEPKDSPSFQVTLGASITALCLHPTLPVIFVGLDSGKLLRYDILNMELPLQSIVAHMDGITSISISLRSENGRPAYLATASKDLSAKIWELELDSTLSHIKTLIGHEHTVSDCQLFERGADLLLATCSRDLFVKVWDTSNGWCIKSFQPHTQWIRSINVHGEFILTGSNDSAIRLTHWPSGNGLSMGIGHEFPVEKVLILIPDPAHLQPQYQPLGFQNVASASRDGTIRIWKVCLPKFIPHRPPRPNPLDTNFKVIAVLKDHQSWVRDLHQFQNKLFSCSDDGTVKCWELNWEKLSDTTCAKSWDLSKNGFQNCLTLDNITFTALPLRKLLLSGSNEGTLTCFMR
ncbi:unnamed protein product [Kluyveromyces dobzhanskii CBS 2104]|uniref:WGS project CCBQ000000000 data, contig 00099 n=1 Tax=Kluyveromyces dobzhanskii CBS 2104 TaxID=1427455 RepID=A0A0A8L4D9_9SACH|nr:unnamed protein product [Kluyveromyces dobzhanskii CBS 2104]